MTVQEMVYQFRLRAQRVDTNSSPTLKTATIITFLNGGMNSLLKERYGTANKYQAALEGIQKRIDEWQRLIVPHEELTGTKVENTNRFEFSIADTKEKYLFLLRAAFAGTKGSCQSQKLVGILSVSNNLEADLDNPNANPNFEWRECLYRLAQNNIIAYSDSTFSIDTADIDYLRYPKPIDIEGYEHFDKSPSANVDCELPDFLHSEIIDQAVVEFELSLKHPGIESSMAKKQITE